MTETPESRVVDPGLDEAIAKLTPEKIQAAVQRVFTKESAARLKIYLETCVRCGLCAEGCHTYLSRDKDPLFSPVGKVKRTIWELVKRDGKVSPEKLKEMARIAFTECGACRRCAMYCPFGIDISYLILQMRRICNLLGAVPLYLQDTTNSHAAFRWRRKAPR
jgi:succinate dehydrogenase/fumarate reductase-like Fe-S protein